MTDTPSKGYEQAGTWAGMPRFQCASCSYDSVDEARIVRHVAASHPAGPTHRATGLAGPDGAPLVVPISESATDPPAGAGSDEAAESTTGEDDPDASASNDPAPGTPEQAGPSARPTDDTRTPPAQTSSRRSGRTPKES